MSLGFNFTLGNPKNITPKGCSTHLRFVNQSNSNAIYRNVLRQSFGNAAYRFNNGTIKWAHQPGVSRTTPFRTAMNAGDINGAGNCSSGVPAHKDILPKPANQVKVGPSVLHGWQLSAGSNQTVDNGSYYTGNPRFVYDGSDYVRFKKLQAINRNYNDPTFGGNDHDAQQQAYRRTHG